MALTNPEAIAAFDEAMPGEWGTVPMIRNSGEASDRGGNTLAVTKSSKHPELASELIAYMTSRENIQSFCHNGNWIPSRTSLSAEDIGYADREDVMQQFIDQGSTIPLSTVKAQSGEYFSSLNTVSADYLDLCFLGQLTPQEASAQMMEVMLSVTSR